MGHLKGSIAGGDEMAKIFSRTHRESAVKRIGSTFSD
jgi:hypothetical protein